MTNRQAIRIALFALLVSLATGALVWGLSYRDSKKIAVVDAIKLFNSYKMKKELESTAAGELQALGKRADSLKAELEMRSKMSGADGAELNRIYNQFQQARGAFEQAYEESNRSINEQVWKRLNPEIDAYGKEQHLRLIIGANGMGSVLYNDAFYDHTQLLTDFVNKRYEKGN